MNSLKPSCVGLSRCVSWFASAVVRCALCECSIGGREPGSVRDLMWSTGSLKAGCSAHFQTIWSICWRTTDSVESDSALFAEKKNLVLEDVYVLFPPWLKRSHKTWVFVYLRNRPLLTESSLVVTFYFCKKVLCFVSPVFLLNFLFSSFWVVLCQSLFYPA